jgi:polyisoprenoid-binding protein YceI
METQTLTQRSTEKQTSQVTLWELDPAHSSASFSVRHMMIAKVHGGFTKLSGTLRLDRQDLSKSSVEAVIDASSIDTREPKRDEHLRSADFFDVERFPTLIFKSKAVRQSGDGIQREGIQVVGDLSLHGITREVTLSVEGLDSEMKDPWGNTKIGASATTKIKRKDYGLNWNAALEAGGVLVGDEITITLDVQFVQKG